MAKLFSHCKTRSHYRIYFLEKCKLKLSKGENRKIRRGNAGDEERNAESVKDTTRQNIEVMRY